MEKYKEKECNVHGNTKFKLMSNGKRNDITRYVYKCIQCRTHHQNEYLRRVKKRCVEYKGGKCEKCGYNKCLRSLDFHHVNPFEKDFDICGGQIRSWDRLKTELDKCILVCRNCHGEIHESE